MTKSAPETTRDYPRASEDLLYEIQMIYLLRGYLAGTRANPFIRTPKTCPRSGRWKFVYLPRYDEPYGVQRSTSTTRCRG